VKYILGLLKTQHCIRRQSDNQEGIPENKGRGESNKQDNTLANLTIAYNPHSQLQMTVLPILHIAKQRQVDKKNVKIKIQKPRTSIT
jgi:hypothetical protein